MPVRSAEHLSSTKPTWLLLLGFGLRINARKKRGAPVLNPTYVAVTNHLNRYHYDSDTRNNWF